MGTGCLFQFIYCECGYRAFACTVNTVLSGHSKGLNDNW